MTDNMNKALADALAYGTGVLHKSDYVAYGDVYLSPHEVVIAEQAAQIEYWKTEAHNVRRELKSEQKQTDSAMDNYDAMQRRCEAQAVEIEKLREVVAIMHTAFAAYADSPAKKEAIALAAFGETK